MNLKVNLNGLEPKVKPVEPETESEVVDWERILIAGIIDDNSRLYWRERGANAGDNSGGEGGEEHVDLQNILLMPP